jgi:hypothetical protein
LCTGQDISLHAKDSYGDGWHGGYWEIKNGDETCKLYGGDCDRFTVRGSGTTYTFRLFEDPDAPGKFKCPPVDSCNEYEYSQWRKSVVVEAPSAPTTDSSPSGGASVSSSTSFKSTSSALLRANPHGKGLRGKQ